MIPIRALIDTGASCTCIDPAHLTQLGLSPTAPASVHTPSTGGTAAQAWQYDVSLTIVSTVNEPVLSLGIVPVLGSELRKQGIDALIGRDVLAGLVFHYNGSTGFYTLAY